VGKWRKETKDLNLMFNFEEGAVQIGISGLRGSSGFSGAGVGRFSEVKEDAQGRFFELESSTAESCGLPQRIYYHFDQDKLVLDVSEGGLKGQHELVRDKGFYQSYALWTVGAVLLIGVLVVGILFIRRKRARTGAEPRAADVTINVNPRLPDDGTV